MASKLQRSKRLCDFCSGSLEAKRVDLELRVGGRLRVFADTPAEVCSQCGMEYVDDATMDQIDEALLAKPEPKPAKYLRVPVYQLAGR